MPTESDFLRAADMFDEARTSVRAVPSAVGRAFGSEVTTGGQLTLEIEALVVTTSLNSSSDHEGLKSLADKCRERAAIVASYAEALGFYSNRLQSYEWSIDRWQRTYSGFLESPESHRHPGPQPTAPTMPEKPAAWVEL